MPTFWQASLVAFAAVGFAAVGYTVFQWLWRRLLRQQYHVELVLYADGCDPAAEQALRAALRVQKEYFPALMITFVETGNGEGVNVARKMSICHHILYLK